MARDNPRCLPPTRTLHRIRWPLRPRSRDCLDAEASETTAERRSHVVLSLGRSFTNSREGSDEGRLTNHRFTEGVAGAFAPETSPARPPFTLTVTLFGALRASLFEARMLLADFCNEHDVRT